MSFQIYAIQTYAFWKFHSNLYILALLVSKHCFEFFNLNFHGFSLWVFNFWKTIAFGFWTCQIWFFRKQSLIFLKHHYGTKKKVHGLDIQWKKGCVQEFYIVKLQYQWKNLKTHFGPRIRLILQIWKKFPKCICLNSLYLKGQVWMPKNFCFYKGLL